MTTTYKVYVDGRYIGGWLKLEDAYKAAKTSFTHTIDVHGRDYILLLETDPSLPAPLTGHTAMIIISQLN